MAKQQPADLTVIDRDLTNVDALLDQFDKVEDSKLQALTSEYLKFEPQKKYSLIFTGMTTMTGEKGGTIEAVMLTDKSRTSYINGNTVLVQSLKKCTSIPALVRIVTGGMIKNPNGSYLSMDVFVVPQETAK